MRHTSRGASQGRRYDHRHEPHSAIRHDPSDCPAHRPGLKHHPHPTDNLGYGDQSAYGQAQFATPGIDHLAREGTRFTHYYAGSTVCAPWRGALMTGMHTGHAWIRGSGEIQLRAEDVTVAMLLRDAGYRTGTASTTYFGSWTSPRASTIH